MTMKCSFCGKSQDMVKKMVAGPGVYICDECIGMCQEFVEEELGEPRPEPPTPVYVILEDGKVKSAVFDSDLALRQSFNGSGETSIMVFDGNTGDLLETFGKNKEESKKNDVKSRQKPFVKAKTVDWVQTDTLQWVKQLDEDRFEVVNGERIPGGTTIANMVVDVLSYSESELEEFVTGYYDSLEHLKEENGENWKQIIAEIIAETSIHPTEMTFDTNDALEIHLEITYGIDCQ